MANAFTGESLLVRRAELKDLKKSRQALRQSVSIGGAFCVWEVAFWGYLLYDGGTKRGAAPAKEKGVIRMKIAIVYQSMTGNTLTLAQAIREALAGEEIVYFGKPGQVPEADLYLVGSWTDKGSCHQSVAEYLKSLEGKTLAYFGTAGFGGSDDYYALLFQRVSALIPQGTRVLGSYYCQGKMPQSVRQRYEKLLEDHPGDKQLEENLENFDRALSHPDKVDLKQAGNWAKQMVSLALEEG